MPKSIRCRTGEVSCRITEYVLQYFERKGLSTAHLTQGLAYSLEELQTNFASMPWDDYLIFFRNYCEGLTPAEMVELCSSYSRYPLLRNLLSAAGLFYKPVRYFELAAEPKKGAFSQLFRCLEPSISQINSREVDFCLRVREGYTLPPDLFWQSHAIGLAAVTTHFGLSPSLVSWEPVDRGALYHIRLPANRPFKFALSWLTAWFRTDTVEDVRSALAYGYERSLLLEQEIEERRRVESTLRETKQWFHSICDSVPGVVYRYVLRPDGRDEFTYVSAGITSVTGLAASEITADATRIWSLVHPDDVSVLRESIRVSARDHTNWSSEFRFVLADGAIRWVSANASLESGLGEAGVAWNGIVTDITDHRRTEEKLRAQTARLEAITTTSVAHILEIDREGTILYANRSSAGRTVADLIGKQVTDFTSKPERNRAIEIFERVFRTRQSFTGEFYANDGDGGQRVYMVTIAPIEGSEQVDGLVLTAFDVTEQHLAEARLREQDELLHKLSDQVPGVIYQFQQWSDGRVCFPYASQGIQKIYEVTCAEVRESADTVFQRLHPDDFAGVVESIRLSSVTMEPWRYEYRVQLPVQGIRWLEGHAVPERMSDGSTLWHGFIQDISERKMIDQSLRASEERFRAFMQHSPIVAWIVSDDGQILFANDNFGNAIGLPPEDALGKNLEDLFAYEHAAEYFENNRKVLESGVPLQVFEQVPRPDGTMGLYMCYKFLLPTAGGNRQLGGLALDITEHKRAEDALRESEARYRRAERGTNDGLWEWNIVAGDDYFSPRWLELLGYSRGDLPNTVDTFRDLLHPDDLQRVLDAVERHLVNNDLYCVEMRLRCKDGEYLWVQSRGVAERNEAGVPIRMAGSITDISDRRRAEVALRESEYRLQQAIRVAQIGIFDHNHATDTIYWSPEQRIIHGLSANDQVTLEDFLKLVHPDDRAEIAEAVRKAHDPDGAGLFDVEHRIQRGTDGEIRWLETRSQTYFEGEGEARRPIRTVGAVLDFTERKLADEEAIRSRDTAQRALADLRIESARAEQFYRLSEQAGQGIGIAKLDGSFLYLNPKFRQLLAIADDADVSRYTFWDFMAEQYRAFLADTVLPQARETGSWTGEFPLQSLTGNKLDFFNNVFLLRDSEGEVVGYSNVASDITELKRIENALRESEGQLAEAQRIARVGSWNWEPSTNKVTWSDSLCSLFGVNQATAQPSFEAFLTLLHPDDRSTAVQRVEAMLAGADEFANDLRIVRPDGVCLWLHRRARAIRDAAGKIVRVDGTDQDITERKQAELALGASELRYRTLFETSSDAIFVMGIDGRIRSANAAAAKTHGYTVEELLQISIQELDTPESAAAVTDRMQRLQNGESLTFEVTHMRRDGSSLPMEVIASAVMVDDEWLVFGFNRDITDRKKAELREAAHILGLKRLAELSLTLSGEPNVVFERLVKIIGELFAVRVVCLSEIVGDQLHFRAVNVDGQLFTDAGTCPLNITPCAAVQTSKDVRVFDAVAERFPQATFLQEHQAESYFGFPSLDNDGNVVAVTCLLDDKPREFTEYEQHILRIIGQRLASEVERSKTISQRQKAEVTLRESEERLRIALSAATAVAFVWDVPTDQVTRYFSSEPAFPANLYAPEPVAAVRAMVYPEDKEVVQR